ncbi:MAG: nucleotidyltransferase family protein [Deltaproteobacteria bacterium]|nr:nucleotidyltransferase family protein [Deltaproteobacteria bacterium]
MKAMIMAAGLGSRLGALTKNLPKALIPVGSGTMLDLVVEKLKAAGVDELIINLHYRGQQIRDHVAQKKSYGLRVEFSEEPEILGTGGGLRKVEHFFRSEKEFFVHNCDVYSDLDLREVVAAQRASSAIGTLVVLTRVQSSYLVFDSNLSLIGWEMANGSARDFAREEVQAKSYCYTGIRMYTPEIFEYMRHEPAHFSVIPTYINAVRAGKLIKAFPIDTHYWIDMGTPDNLKELEAKLKG